MVKNTLKAAYSNWDQAIKTIAQATTALSLTSGQYQNLKYYLLPEATAITDVAAYTVIPIRKICKDKTKLQTLVETNERARTNIKSFLKSLDTPLVFEDENLPNTKSEKKGKKRKRKSLFLKKEKKRKNPLNDRVAMLAMRLGHPGP